MASKHVFDNSVIDYNNYVSKVGDMLMEGSIICTKDQLTYGLQDVTSITDPIRQLKMIKTSLYIDKELSRQGSGKNIFKKLPIILTLADIINNHYSLVEHLDYKELGLLSFFEFQTDRNYLCDDLILFANHDLLTEAISKTNDVLDQMNILCVIEDKSLEFAIDKESKEGQDKFVNEARTFIKNTSLEEFTRLEYELYVNTMNQLGI